MKCERVRLERDAGDLNLFVAWRIRRHVRRCPDCAVAVEATRRLEERLREDSSDAPPAFLRDRITEALAAGPPPESAALDLPPPDESLSRFPRSSTMRWRFATGVVVVCASGLLAASLWNGSAFGEMKRMESAVSDAKSAHSIGWKIMPDGTRVKISETWYQEGKWRFESSGGLHDPVQIYKDGRFYRYDKKADEIDFERADGPYGFKPSGFTLRSEIGDDAKWGWKVRTERRGWGRLNGRRVREVLLIPPIEPYRILYYVEPKTDRPVRTETMIEREGAWRVIRASETTYDRPIPPGVFDPKGISKTATFVDRDEGRMIWSERLAKGIARKRIGPRTVVLRDVQVNEGGDVFLLYTAGAHPSERSFLLDGGSIQCSDDRGTLYLQPGLWFFPFAKEPPIGMKGYVFDGEKLEGAWFVPSEPMKEKPASLRFAFAVPYAEKIGRRKRHMTAQETFSIPVRPPTTSILPEWMPYMALGLKGNWEVEYSRAMARARHDRAIGDHRKAAEMLREALKANELKGDDASLLCDLGDELAATGDQAGASTSYREALDQPMLMQAQRDRIRLGLARLKLSPAPRPAKPHR